MSTGGGADLADLIVEVRGASRRFRVGSEDIWAVRDVSLQVRRGEFVGLIGRSGSGKTTLLNLVAGLDQPSEGTVLVGGEEITRYSERQLTEMRRRRVGFRVPVVRAFAAVVGVRECGVGVADRGGGGAGASAAGVGVAGGGGFGGAGAASAVRVVGGGSSSVWRLRGHWRMIRC